VRGHFRPIHNLRLYHPSPREGTLKQRRNPNGLMQKCEALQAISDCHPASFSVGIWRHHLIRCPKLSLWTCARSKKHRRLAKNPARDEPK